VFGSSGWNRHRHGGWLKYRSRDPLSSMALVFQSGPISQQPLVIGFRPRPARLSAETSLMARPLLQTSILTLTLALADIRASGRVQARATLIPTSMTTLPSSMSGRFVSGTGTSVGGNIAEAVGSTIVFHSASLPATSTRPGQSVASGPRIS
jgi:hypothetical protein